jgi:competence protein ComEC
MFHHSYVKEVCVIALLLVLVCVLWFLIYTHEHNTDTLTVAFLNVGQGDAIYIETPSGVQVLIDAGSNNGVLRELGRVMPFWDRSIDIVMGTHPDMDHIGGIPGVFERFNVEHLLIPGIGADTDLYSEMLLKAKLEPVEIHIARRGQVVIDQTHNISLEILFPDRDVSGVEKNLGSIVCKLTYGETSFLFTGDSPIAIEKYLVAQVPELLNVDVLKLGHHGSDTSSSLEFLGYTSPDIAIISAGKDNSYGHPHKEVLERLDEFEIPYLNTGTDGRIVFVSDGKTITHK